MTAAIKVSMALATRANSARRSGRVYSLSTGANRR